MAIYIKNLTDTVLNIVDLNISLLLGDKFEIKNTYILRDSSEILKRLSEAHVSLFNDLKELLGSDAIKFIYDSIDQTPKDRSGKIRVHQTARKIGTIVYFAGSGDDISNINDIGNGEPFVFSHSSEDPNIQIKYFDFNTLLNETYFQEGYLIWEGAQFDTLSMSIVPRTVLIIETSNTNFRKHGSGIIIPAAGDGDIQIDSDISEYMGGLVYMPTNDLGEPEIGFWDADWNNDTQKFENIRPNLHGYGKFNLFWKEVEFAKFLNKIPLLGTGFERLVSNDSDQIGHGMRLKGTIITNGSSHSWKVACMMCMFRDKTA